MPRKKVIPSYRLHKAHNCAVVTIDGTNFYLGPYDSPDSYEKYARLITEWKVKKAPAKPASPAGSNSEVTQVRDLLLAWMRHAEQRYVKNGRPTSEVHSFQTALKPVRKLYGTQPIASFGPLALVACRQVLIEKGYCRKRINQHVGRIRQVFKWGVSREMVPETVWRALCSVTGLRYGEGVERPRVRPVPEERIEAIRPFLPPPIAAMIDLQLWSACRPGEACLMRAIDINMTDEIWEYRPSSHKVEHHDKERVIYLGPHAQAVIKPWLTTDLYAYLFSPRAARAWSEVQRARNRKTPLPRHPKLRTHKEQPQRQAGYHYTDHSYRRAICRACEQAFDMPKELRCYPKGIEKAEKERLQQLAAEWRRANAWNPHRLRHNAGTRIRKAYGVEMSRIILGVSSISVATIYAEESREKAHKIMGNLG